MNILTGQQVWQSTGGQQLGSNLGPWRVPGPDWSADWLHREALALLQVWAEREGAASFAHLPAERQAALRDRCSGAPHQTYDAETGTVTVSPDRREAVARTAQHYDGLFGGDPSLRPAGQLRHARGDDPGSGPARRPHAVLLLDELGRGHRAAGLHGDVHQQLAHEPLIGNRPTGANVLWSILSVLPPPRGHRRRRLVDGLPRETEPEVAPPAVDPLAGIPPHRLHARRGQIPRRGDRPLRRPGALGALTAHYTVEGQAFFGLPLADWIPYSLSRTWHIQTAVFWIATAFLAAGLFLGPAVGGREPRFQRLGVNLLFGALLLVVAGSLAGEYFSITSGSARCWLLVRPPGLRICGPRARLANRPVHRPGVVARVDAPRGSRRHSPGGTRRGPWF